MSNLETIRRLILADLRRILRHRYGAVLPNDDAGRDDLMLLLRLAAASPKAAREKMQHEIEVYAPWATDTETEQWIDDFQMLDRRRVWLSGKELGERLNLTNSEREEFKAWRILPVDMTPDDLAKQRKAKDRARKAINRHRRGVKPRHLYVATSLSQQKPWVPEKISRRTWERRRAKSRDASPTAPILIEDQDTLASPSGAALGPSRRSCVFDMAKAPVARQAATPFSPKPSSTADTLTTPRVSRHTRQQCRVEEIQMGKPTDEKQSARKPSGARLSPINLPPMPEHLCPRKLPPFDVRTFKMPVFGVLGAVA